MTTQLKYYDATAKIWVDVDSAHPLPVTGGGGGGGGDASAANQVTGNASLATIASATHAEDSVSTSGDLGVLSLNVRNDDGQTAQTNTNGDYAALAVDVNGALFTRERPSTVAGTPVAFALAANTSITLLAANAARRGATIYNNSGQTVFLRFGATAVTSILFTVAVVNGAYFEVPFKISAAIQGLSTLAGSTVAAGVGLFVTEFTS